MYVSIRSEGLGMVAHEVSKCCLTTSMLVVLNGGREAEGEIGGNIWKYFGRNNWGRGC